METLLVGVHRSHSCAPRLKAINGLNRAKTNAIAQQICAEPIPMKRTPLSAGLSSASLFLGLLLSVSTPGQDTPYTEVDRGLHHRVWERTQYELSPSGQPVPKVHRYVELATGMYRLASGQFVEASDTIEPFPGGAIARQGQHSVIFANNLATPGAIHLQAPDGKEFKSHILGLGYLETTTGKHVLFAEIKDCQGVIDANAPNRILYRDAMSDVSASVAYTYTRDGLEQDILIEPGSQPLPTPEDFQLNRAATFLTVITEFIDPPVPGITPVSRVSLDGQAQPDSFLDFGAMKIGHGRALFLGTTPDARPVPVTKQWLEIDKRHLLLEQVPVPAFEKELNLLNQSGTASLGTKTKTTRLAASKGLQLPPPRRAHNSEKPMLLAKVTPPRNALLLDYPITLTSATNFTFAAGTTYSISGTVNLAGVTTVEGGAVLKFPVSASASIVTTNLVSLTRPYCPVIVTASTDSNYGESVSGGGINGYYGKTAFDLSGASTPQVLSNFRFCYLSNAVAGANITLNDAQVINCKSIFASGSTQPTLNNVLAYRTHTLLANSAATTLTASHLTAHFCTNLLANTSGTLRLTNSLMVCVTNWQCANTYTNAAAFLNSDTGVFQTAGGGRHYLAPDSPYRNAGTTNINTNVLASIRTKTTYPPIVFSNVTLSADMTFYPQAQRDTDQPDIGAEYDPIDVVFGGVTANSNLTFTAGTVAGWFRTSSGWNHAGHGIHLGDGTTATFDGRAESPACWVRSCAAQEGGTGYWEGGYGPGGITGWTTPSFAQAPRLNMRFTKCSTGGDLTSPFRDDWGYLVVNASHSEFNAPGLGGYMIALNFTNCLFERVPIWTQWDDNGVDRTNNAIRLRNCTLRGGSLSLSRVCNYSPAKWPPWLVRDTILDGTTVSLNDGAGGAASVTDFNYNAFLSGAPRLTPNGANDVLVTGSFNWQSSWLSRYYLPSNSPVIDQGSATANLVGLYHFTSQVPQTKEQSSQVDIGFHLVATDSSGKPIDSDGDGYPDYQEDLDGDSAVDSGETDWQSATDSGLRVWITQPKRNSNLP